LDTALLVLDIQKDFIGDQARMSVAKHQIEPMLEKVNTIIAQFNSHRIPVVYIGNEFEPYQWIANFFRKNSAIKGSNGAELDERLLIVNDLYFSKNKANALSNDELVSYLNASRVKHIVIVGLFAEGCVTATALDSVAKNFTVTVVSDAVASLNDKKRVKALNALSSHGVTITDSSQLFEVFLN
jgi:maleamate amidohydrolase